MNDSEFIKASSNYHRRINTADSMIEILSGPAVRNGCMLKPHAWISECRHYDVLGVQMSSLCVHERGNSKSQTDCRRESVELTLTANI